MAVYGPVRHQKNIIWTEASEVHILTKTNRENKNVKYNIKIYYTLRFYFPYLSLLAQPVTIFVYGPVVYGPARYLHYFR
jgi:hypothetical protein